MKRMGFKAAVRGERRSGLRMKAEGRMEKKGQLEEEIQGSGESKKEEDVGEGEYSWE